MGNQNSRNFTNIDNKNQKISENKTLTDEMIKHNCEDDDSMSRTASGADISEKTFTQLVPIEKLSKILQEKTQNKFGVKGIMSEVFVTHVFSGYSDLGERLFNYFHQNARAKTVHLGEMAFRQQCEQFLGIIDDSRIMAIYVQFYANPDNTDIINKNGVKNLLRTCFAVAMSHYSGQSKNCPMMERTISAVTKSIFFSQENENLSVGFVCRWIEHNCIRLVLLIHKFCVHTLATIYRGLEQSDICYGIELSTPVLEQGPEFSDKIFEMCLMPLSQAWLLAGALPPLYSKPQIVTPTGTTNTTLQVFKNKLSPIPSHWTLLYDSNQHGSGANRFLHHVLGYKGPTLILLYTKDEQTYCIASPTEWKETHLYTGGEGSCILQLLPKFEILEKKPNILCLNTSIRGYPKGLRVGADPRKPVLSVDEHFEKIDVKGMPNILLTIEVWGCGDKSSLDVQLDIKKWQIKEAERQRTVKLTAADWMDHPDRYLLELGGRANYNN